MHSTAFARAGDNARTCRSQIRDDGRPGPTRRALFFVHGFNSSKATWQPLLTLLEQDQAITTEFDLHTFSYETAFGAIPVVRRLPTLDEAGKSLAATLTAELVAPDGFDRYIDMTLVGHSMGGLIIQSALLELLAPSGSMRTVDHIRQVMLFATPNFGSTTLGKLRSVVSQLWRTRRSARCDCSARTAPAFTMRFATA